MFHKLTRTKLLAALALVLLLSMSAHVAAAQGEDTYIVQPGDTLASIAARYNTTVEAIAARNGIINPNRVVRGQRLIIPRPGTNVNATVRTYTVQPGDTLRDIALRYNTTIEALVQANNITASTIIRPGQVLNLPAQGGVITPPRPVVRTPITTVPGPRVIVNGRYVVQPGDTLFAVARSFNVGIYDIARANGLLNLNRIFIGQSLRIPGY